MINSGALPTGRNTTAGITGSEIDVNNRLVELGPNARRPIERRIKIHTLGNSVIPRSNFNRWSRWYQEDGNTQVFRLFKGEENVRNSRSAAARIEAFRDVGWGRGAWHEWVATYTFIEPLSCAIFQARNTVNDWSVQLGMSPEGHVTLNHRRGTDKVLGRNMKGKPFHVRIRDNGHNYEVYYNGVLEGRGTWARPKGKTFFRWGCYEGKGIPERDGMLFVTGATVDPSNNPPPVNTPNPTPTPNPPSAEDLSCLAAGKSERLAQSAFSSQCAGFSRRDCDAITGRNDWWVCSTNVMDGGVIPTVDGGSLTIQAEDYQRGSDSTEGNRGGQYRSGDIDIVAANDGGAGFAVGHIATNETLIYDFLNLREEQYQLELRTSSFRDTGLLNVLINGENRLGSLAVPFTGNWNNYETMTVDLGRLDQGSHSVTIDVKGAPFNINWLKLVPIDSPQPTRTPAPTPAPTIAPTPVPTAPPNPIPTTQPSNCLSYQAGARQEITLAGGACIDFTSNINSKTLQVWDSDSNSSCNFRGTITSINGNGELNVDANYVQSNTLSGTRLRISPSNGCAYLKVRIF